MTGEFLRIGARNEDGYPRALVADSKGNLQVKVASEEVIEHINRNFANQFNYAAVFYGIEEDRRDNITPFNINNVQNRMVFIENNTNKELWYRLNFYSKVENDVVASYIARSDELILQPGEKIIINTDFPLLRCPFPGLTVSVRNELGATGNYNIRLFGGS